MICLFVTLQLLCFHIHHLVRLFVKFFDEIAHVTGRVGGFLDSLQRLVGENAAAQCMCDFPQDPTLVGHVGHRSMLFWLLAGGRRFRATSLSFWGKTGRILFMHKHRRWAGGTSLTEGGQGWEHHAWLACSTGRCVWTRSCCGGSRRWGRMTNLCCILGCKRWRG